MIFKLGKSSINWENNINEFWIPINELSSWWFMMNIYNIMLKDWKADVRAANCYLFLPSAWSLRCEDVSTCHLGDGISPLFLWRDGGPSLAFIVDAAPNLNLGDSGSSQLSQPPKGCFYPEVKISDPVLTLLTSFDQVLGHSLGIYPLVN
jgi:hypothetical protein